MKLVGKFPVEKKAVCLFCGTEIELVRHGQFLNNGTPRFWYVEKTWDEGGENHFCQWIIDRPEKAGPLPEEDMWF